MSPPAAVRTHHVTRAEAQRQIDTLRRQIRHHDYRYYVLDQPAISDAAYDGLMQRLQALEARFPDLITPDSPTQRVAGQVRAGFRTIAHHAPMLSLDSTTDAEAVRQFDARMRAAIGPSLRYVLEPKFDGLSIEVVYRDGRLAEASTRGDGTRGEDVTANVRTIRSVPLRLRESAEPAPRLLAVRGEILMRRRDFAALNERLRRAGQPLFANPRNAAAGSVRQLDARVTASRALHAYFYDILAVDRPAPPSTASQCSEWISNWGLRLGPHRRMGTTADDILAYRERMAIARPSLDIEIDGVVAKIDSLAARRRLGSTARHPRWAAGVKFVARSATTRLEAVDVRVGRTGVLTPVAVLTPVDIGGVTVTHATLHNWNELARRQLRIGDTVQIERAGDVIPEVVGRVARRRGTGSAPQAPRRCPVCRSRVVVRGAFRLCPNTLGCAAQRARAIEHFASRDAFDIDGLGPGTVEALLRTGMVRNVADLFTLTDDDLRGLPRFGAVSANRLNAAIAAARRVGLARFLFALGIPSVGAATAAALAARFKTLEAVRHASARQLADARGVGPAAGREIAAFLRSPANQAIIGDLLRNGVTVLPFQHTGAAAHGGKTVVFTGRLETMTRSEAQRLVEDNGGRVAAAVSQATDLVVAGSAPGSKLARARALGIPVVSERQFLRRYAASRRPRPRRRTASSTSPASLS